MMVACLLALALTGTPQATGMAYHYNSGGMASVARVRSMPLRWGRVSAFVSVPDCRRVDAAQPWAVRFRLYDPVRQRWGPVETGQVTDCSNPRDLPAHRRKGIAPGGIEVDFATAARYHFAWPGGDGKTRVQVLGYRRLP